MPTEYKPAVFMLVSTLSLSFSGVIAKYLTGQFSLPFLVFIRVLAPALLMLSVMTASRFVFPQKNLIKAFVIRALCVAGCQFCFLASLSMLSLVESVVLFATGPLFIPVLEKLIFKVKISGSTKAGLAATFAGVILMAGDGGEFTLKPELLIGLMAGFFNAGSQLSLYRSTKGSMSPMAVNGWSFLFSAIFILPVILWSGLSEIDLQSVSEPVSNWLVWLAVFALSVAIMSNQLFRSKAYKLAESNSQLAPLIFTNLIFTLCWQLMFFDEVLTTEKILGVSLIITASLAQTLFTKKSAAGSKNQKLSPR